MPLPSFFFFNDTATTEIYTLSLHDALPISREDLYGNCGVHHSGDITLFTSGPSAAAALGNSRRSEEHTSELQSRPHLVCRLLLEKKNMAGNLSNIALDAT